MKCRTNTLSCVDLLHPVHEPDEKCEMFTLPCREIYFYFALGGGGQKVLFASPWLKTKINFSFIIFYFALNEDSENCFTVCFCIIVSSCLEVPVKENKIHIRIYIYVVITVTVPLKKIHAE